MKDQHCVQFLQWALPRLHMQWAGFRKVRGQVCKRLDRRLRELGLTNAGEYQRYLEANAGEWQCLDAMCRITISRFYRDRSVFATLAQQVIPALADEAEKRGGSNFRIWSVGCGSGEEPYTLSILWRCELRSRFPRITIDIVATDADPGMIGRAHEARYDFSSLKDLPEPWRERAFARDNDAYRLRPAFRKDIRFVEQDIRRDRPEGLFDLVLCRNLVFTYYDDATQFDLFRRIVAAMRRGGALVIGAHERLPQHAEQLSTWFDAQRIYRRAADA